MGLEGNLFGQRVKHPSDDGWNGVDEADRGKEGEDTEADNGLNSGKDVSGGGRDGSTGNGTVFSPRYEAIKWCVDGIVPCARCTSHDDCANKEDEVGTEQRPDRYPEMGACVERAEEVWEIEIP